LLIQRQGGRAGCEVRVCGDTTSAWAALHEQRPALVLLDLNLPGEGGDVLCQRIRATPDFADLKIAWLSHWTQSEDVLRGLIAGVDHLFSKELLGQPDDWIARLREILSGSNALAEELQTIIQQHGLLPQAAREIIDSVQRLLRHPALRRFGPDVIREILRRADSPTLDPPHIEMMSSERMATFLVSLAAVLGRLLGDRECARFREGLIAIAHLLCRASFP
jgi:DNA-binding NarL/FixJ family response regulator